jgi:hypothetical protein
MGDASHIVFTGGLWLAAAGAAEPQGPHDLILHGFVEAGVFEELFDLGAGLARADAIFALG